MTEAVKQSISKTAKKGDVVIEARGIIKNYGYLQALSGANLKIHAGEVLALIGDNGAGKSTLANVICGAIQKDGGELILNDKIVEVQSINHAREYGIQVVYQDLALGPDLSVAENIFLGQEIMHEGILGKIGVLNRKDMKDKSVDFLSELGIGLKSMTVPVRSLSGGERQALAVVKAVTWAKTALIMDEPTAALGARQSALVYRTIRNAAESGLAVLVISHDIPKMLEVSDRISVMRHGKVIADLNSKETNIQTVLSLMLSGKASN